MTREYNNIRIEQKLFVGYLLLGYPNAEKFLELLEKLNDSSLDILELGIPSKNPEYDGLIIQEAHKIVDDNLIGDINYYKNIRNSWKKPIWIMGYYNDLINTDLYLELANSRVYDTLVVPDMPLYEYNKYSEILSDFNISLVTFINPEMDVYEMRSVLNNYKLIYGQLYKGKTGNSSIDEKYRIMLNEARKYPNAKLFAGFGIKTREKVEKLWYEGFDGCIIGTEMIKKLNESEEALIEYINNIKER